MWLTKGPTNTSNEYEFTNWDDINQFCQRLRKT
jgi:menaquinone-dependent protoporphyrinogen IX oxidase